MGRYDRRRMRIVEMPGPCRASEGSEGWNGSVRREDGRYKIKNNTEPITCHGCVAERVDASEM